MMKDIITQRETNLRHARQRLESAQTALLMLDQAKAAESAVVVDDMPAIGLTHLCDTGVIEIWKDQGFTMAIIRS